MNNRKNCAAIIVNYRTPELVTDCLFSIMRERSIHQSQIFLTVTIVDNCSGDGSVSIIREFIEENKIQEWATLVNNDINGGFSHGNNLGISFALKKNKSIDYIWLLNSDTIIRDGAYVQLINYMENNQIVGIAGSRLEDPDGTPQVSAFRDFTLVSEMLSGFRFSVFDRIFSKWVVAPEKIPESPMRVDWVAGASLLIRGEAFEKIGFMDERYFLYFEEVDYCLNLRRAGWECHYVPESRVVHLVGATTGISETRKKAPRRPVYWFDSRRYFIKKNYGIMKLFLANILFILGYVSFRIRKIFSPVSKLEPPFFLLDFLRYSFLLKGDCRSGKDS